MGSGPCRVPTGRAEWMRGPYGVAMPALTVIHGVVRLSRDPQIG